MRPVSFSCWNGLAICALLAAASLAWGHSAADYPLRVHIYQHDGVSHYHAGSLDGVDGEGRGNLFENGDPHGFDFRYDCGNRLMNSVSFETYPARWKKPGKTLEMLLPAGGGTCNLRVEVKPDVVYHRHNRMLEEIPAARYKEWMIKHHYDPEHGMNLPVLDGSGEAGAGAQ